MEILIEQYPDSISHLEVVSYLLHCGWKRYESNFKGFTILQYFRNDEVFQVDIPTQRDYVGYQKAMQRAVKIISEAMQIPVSRLISYLTYPIADILYLKLSCDKEGNSGTISFEKAVNLYECSKELLAYASMDSKRKLPRYTRLDNSTKEVIKRIRCGQTEWGSYVIPIICPLVENLGRGCGTMSMFNTEEEYSASPTRMTTIQMMSAIGKTKVAIDSAVSDDIIYSNEGQSGFTSVSFLEALSKGISEKGYALTFSMRYAPVNNLINNEPVTFTYDYYNPLRSLISSYKRKFSNNIRIAGYISKLSAAGNRDQRKDGVITVSGVESLNGKKRNIRFRLNAEDYADAILAHSEGCMVEVETLPEEDKPSKILDCISFKILFNNSIDIFE